MSDLFESYKKGIDYLLETMGKEHADFNRAYAQRNRLIENIEKAELHGDDPARKADRNEILYNLDRIALHATGKLFHKFYELDQALPSHESTSTRLPPASESDQQELPDDSLSPEQYYITFACNYVSTIYEASQNASQLFLSDDDIWPAQCQDAISIFQRLQQPLLPDNLPYSSLEVTLSSINEQVDELIGLIDSFSPFGRGKSAKARNLRHTIRQKLNDFPQYLTPAIDLINTLGKSTGNLDKCTLPFRVDDEVR